MKKKSILHYFQKKIIGGFGIGIGLVIAFGIYVLVQAVVPGTVQNPTFGPQQNDVEFTRALESCVWMSFVSSGNRVTGAVSTCPAGKSVVGYQFWASNNQQEDWEIEVMPDSTRARRVSGGTSMGTSAYCCIIK